MRFVILLGIVSLFADMTYEAARSISGQYLAILGATGAAVGVISGLGEFIGYAFRFISGYFSDRTGKYWFITFVGYSLNLLVVPLLALAGSWPIAGGLLILERFGKAIRTPARDAMLSYATKEVGRGWGFGLHEAMDQIGAILGPLIIGVLLYSTSNYQLSFGVLLIPALCSLGFLCFARFLYPYPRKLEIETPPLSLKDSSSTYWLYLAAVSCVAAGYIDFPLIAYHLQKSNAITPFWIPIIFAFAMGIEGLSALFLGWLFDKKGVNVLIVIIAMTSPFALLVFLDNFYFLLLGMILWGMGLGAQESIMRAIVANLAPIEKRGTAYGIFNLWFGTFWFLGSALMGFLYDISLLYLIIFSTAMQLTAVPLLLVFQRKFTKFQP